MPVDPHLLLAFIATVLIVCLVPGPDMLFIVATALRHGPRGGVVAATGMATGMAFHTIAAVIGLSALVASSATAFSALRYAGAAYLIWLAVLALRDGAGTQATQAHGAATAPDAAPRSSGPGSAAAGRVWRQAAVTNLLNPKIVVFYLAFLPGFTAPGRGPLGLQLLILGGVFLLIGLVVDACVGALAGGAGRRLATSRRARRALDRIAATVYAGLAARLVSEG